MVADDLESMQETAAILATAEPVPIKHDDGTIHWQGASQAEISGAPEAVAAPSGLRGLVRRGKQLQAYEPLDVASMAPGTVLLNVYDIGDESEDEEMADLIWRINRLSTVDDRVLMGGVYHAGVEIYGREWGYGGTDEYVTGIAACPPRCNWQHTYRATVVMGPSPLTESEVAALLEAMQASPEWCGIQYDLLNHNCLHFANKFCTLLGVGRIPGWIDRFGRIGSSLEKAYGRAHARWEGAKELARGFGIGRQDDADAPSQGLQGIGSSLSQWGRGLFAAATRSPDQARDSRVRPRAKEPRADDLRASLRNRGGIRLASQQNPERTELVDAGEQPDQDVDAALFHSDDPAAVPSKPSVLPEPEKESMHIERRAQ